ncbi:uncharacterized protein LOC132824979 [Hemiscyllium ocellatum]|uniref:uncharacterized protein LOC132824979 n=1 Tax=Hemiscyllium ocellatum TaxID=170820 RepID=UPI0029675422|nr:uncharacterized protein LOC132824979 [Hemiscyllium ocellatum]XP_060695898.1 uncharacterized protein LOC132824979 [Hemiscyllium ocellatum]XP_060695899.1 uncharacterized protein LOC132824979 [Hemiscyllium ocellatum]XP_060695901.1 uncharacterized protein LOC132824979 [Hemiscyllium ocellatum]XP_060695902.1 uncharacterized protein LOC132824979 [Hemiscyllium ocellatum]XP_060695903.1 uncharacterized protein LOC132824979 [Hemiscyllium ocellatum]XP_060695904.1 uncharacterized protein LOC132824979 [
MKMYDCKRGFLPPYPISKPIRNDVTYTANRTCAHPASTPHQPNSHTKPVENALQTLNQMIGTVQPMAQTQEYKSQQMLSVVKANSQAQNTTSVHQVVSQAASQPLPRKWPIPVLPKGSTVTSTRVQQLAVNGLVLVTTTSAGQTVQTPNAHKIYSARVLPAFNPVSANQNVAHSSNLLISLSSANGSVPQISMDQTQVNVSEPQGNGSSILGLMANNVVMCDGQIQGKVTCGKVGTDMNKVPEGIITQNAPPQLGQRSWPALTNGAQERAGSSNNTLLVSEQTGQSACLSSQPTTQHTTSNSWFASANSNGQKRMVLARVTPMSHDWKDLQQNSRSLQSADNSNIKDMPVEGIQLHDKLSDQNGELEDACSTLEKSIEMQNQSPLTEIAEQKRVPPPSLKPDICSQEDVHNIHFYFTPSTMNEVSIITSQVSSSFNAQQNLMSSGNLTSAANVSSPNSAPVTSQLTALSGHCNFGVSSVGSSNSTLQQTVTASPAEMGTLCNSEQQSTLPFPGSPHSVNVLCSAVNIASTSEGKQTIQLVSSGSTPSSEAFHASNSLHSVCLVPRESSGKQATPGLVLVVPPSVLVQNCQNVEASSICRPSTVLTGEEHVPARLTECQGEASSLVAGAPTPESDKSNAAQPAAASPLNLTGQQHEEIISSLTASGIGEPANGANISADPSQKAPAEVLPSSTEVNGKKRNLTLDAGVSSKDCGFQHCLILCDGQENVTDSPPHKRFMASALEGLSKGEDICKNVPLPDEKETTNSSELMTCSDSSERPELIVDDDQTVAKCNIVQSEICITGVFSLGDNTGMWKTVEQSSPCPVVDLTGSSQEEMNDESAIKETGESSLKDQEAHEDCDTVTENPQVPSSPLSNLESERCPSVKESPQMGQVQSALEVSQEKLPSQQTPQTHTSQVNILIDLTADKDDFTEPQQSHSVLPSDCKEQDEKLVSDQNVTSVEINNPSPLKFSGSEPQGLDDLLHSIDTEIETLMNFWNPYPSKFAHANAAKSANKHYDQQKSENCENKLLSVAIETASVSEEVQMPDERVKASLVDNLDCSSSYNIKVLGHTEILNLLAEIAKPKLNEKLPPGSVWSETFDRSDVRLSEEMPGKPSQNASSDGWKAGSPKAGAMKIPGRLWGDQSPTLQPVTNKNSCGKKAKRERKEYCCINAWLAASGVLGIYCNCKLSQGNKTDNQLDLRHAMHENQNSSEPSDPNCIGKHMDVEATLHSVPVATHRGHALEVSESWNTGPRSCSDAAADSNQDEVLRDVHQEVCVVQAMQQQAGANNTRLESNEVVGFCKPGIAHLSSLRMSEEPVGLPCKAAAHEKSDRKESKDISRDLVEVQPDKDTWAALELDDQTANGNRDPPSDILRKKIGDQTDKCNVNRHLGVKLGFKVMKRKPDASNCRSPQKQRKSETRGKEGKSAKCASLQKICTLKKKTRYDADAKLLSNYNCHVMVRDKTYSSSGERAVLVNLVPVSGKFCKTKAKRRAKSQ